MTRVVTIAGVTAGTKEQQYDIAIEEDKRVWRPAVTVLKLLVAAWGDDATEWVGRRAELYGDPTIMFGRDRVGGIRVSRISHIDKPFTASLTETRGKRKAHTVDPLPPADDIDRQLEAHDLAAQVVSALADATTEAEVREWGNRAHARNLLDVPVDGVTVRDRATARLAEIEAEMAGGAA